MRKSRFSEEEMVAIVREADRDPVAEVGKRHRISQQTIYLWRRRFGQLSATVRDAKIPIERSIRLMSGLILFGFAGCHFLSHATGLFLLDATDQVGRGVLLAPWHTWGGLLILFGAVFIHAALGLKALWRRRHLRIPAREAWQLGLAACRAGLSD